MACPSRGIARRALLLEAKAHHVEGTHHGRETHHHAVPLRSHRPDSAPDVCQTYSSWAALATYGSTWHTANTNATGSPPKCQGFAAHQRNTPSGVNTRNNFILSFALLINGIHHYVTTVTPPYYHQHNQYHYKSKNELKMHAFLLYVYVKSIMVCTSKKLHRIAGELSGWLLNSFFIICLTCHDSYWMLLSISLFQTGLLLSGSCRRMLV